VPVHTLHSRARLEPGAHQETHMNASRIFSTLFVMMALALGTLATSACTTADNSASSTSGGSSSGGY
jgi:Mn2+/Fe2+ NRAMP family transporter